MKVLVTGGAGFIGSHLAEALVKKRHQVWVLDNLSSGRKENLPQGAEFVKGDITDAALTHKLARHDFDAIFHHAAQISVSLSVREYEKDANENILGTLNIIRLAQTCGARLQFASSGGTVYGEIEKTAGEDHPLGPLSPYGLSKLAGEQYIQMLLKDTPWQILRYANVYGPRQDPHGEAGVVAIFTNKLLAGEQCALNGGGVCVRDYVYVGDVVQANLLALKHPHSGIFNVGTGTGVSVKRLFDLLCAVGKFHGLAHETPYREGDLQNAILKITKAKRVLGYSPATPLKEGLTRTVAFFRARHEAGGKARA